MTSKPPVTLADWLADLLRAQPSDVLERVSGLATQFSDQLVGEETPPRAAMSFWRAGCTTSLTISNKAPRLEGTCDESQPCVHALTLAEAVRRDLARERPSEGVQALRRAIDPPSAADVFALLDPLLDKPERTAKSVEGRPAWRLAPKGYGLEIQLGQRRTLASGARGKFQPIPLSRLRDFPDTALRPADRRTERVVLPLVGRTSARSPTADAIVAIVEALAGHDDVEWSDSGDRLRVEPVDAGLSVSESPSGWDVSLALGDARVTRELPHQLGDTGVVVVLLERGVVRVAAIPPRLSNLVQHMVLRGLQVPREAGAALVERLARVESALPLRLPPMLAGREVATDLSPRLVVTPHHPQGAGIAVRMRPLRDGPLRIPGEGEPVLTGAVAGERRVVRRDLAIERARASALVSSLALGELDAGEEPWSYEIATDDEMLDLLARLRAPEWEHLTVEWPDQGGRRVVTPPPRALRVEIVERHDWFGVKGKLEVDGATVELAELLRAAREGRRYVALDQSRFVRLEELFEGRLSGLASLTSGDGPTLDLSRLVAAMADDVLGEELPVQSPVSFRQLVERARTLTHEQPSLPSDLRAELRPYQREGHAWLHRLSELGCGAILADDMGLGKTVQAIAVLVERAARGPQLVLAPSSVCFNWQREIERFAPGLRALSLREADRDELLGTLKPGDVVIATYGLLRTEREGLSSVRWASVVFDEAQVLKNAATQTARAARTLESDWRLALTGTPLENHLGELYGIVDLVCPGLLGSWPGFLKRFAAPIEKDVDPRRRAALASLLRPFILRRTKAAVLDDLPPRIEVRLDVELSAAERRLYEAIRTDAVEQLNRDRRANDGESRFEVLAALTRLRQAACHPRLIHPDATTGSSKTEALLEHLSEVLQEGHRALVFSQFTRHLRLVQDALESNGIRTLYLDGATPPSERERVVDSFQHGDAPVFLVSLKAGGTGLNLTAADFVYLLDPWWNPAVEDQAADRAHRIGQRNAVTVVRLVSRGTVEEGVLAMHADKRALVASVLDGTDGGARLNPSEWFDLLRTGAHASTLDDLRQPLGEPVEIADRGPIRPRALVTRFVDPSILDAPLDRGATVPIPAMELTPFDAREPLKVAVRRADWVDAERAFVDFATGLLDDVDLRRSRRLLRAKAAAAFEAGGSVEEALARVCHAPEPIDGATHLALTTLLDALRERGWVDAAKTTELAGDLTRRIR